MKSKYIKAGDKVLALNFKAGSASLIRAIVQAHYPELEETITNQTHYPDGQDANSSRWHYLVDKTENPTVPVVLVVRNPVERFRSACAETRTVDVDALLGKMEAGEPVNNHFWPTSRLLVDGCKLYRFESDLDDVATELGLTLPLPNIAGTGTKPDLTPEQLARVEAIYADDIALYDSITTVGQVYVAPPVPATEEDKEAAKAVVDSALLAKLIEPIFLNGVKVNTDDKTVSELTGIHTAMGLRPNLKVDKKVGLQAGGSAWVQLTATEIGAMVDAVADHKLAAYASAKAKEAEIDAATTLEELETLDLSIT
jgi:hypothetical protein